MRMEKKFKSNFNRYVSVLSEGFTDRDCTPPSTPIIGKKKTKTKVVAK